MTSKYMPDNLAGRQYYVPSLQGSEAKIAEAKARRKQRDAQEGKKR